MHWFLDNSNISYQSESLLFYFCVTYLLYLNSAGDALTGGTQIDVVLVVLVCHKKSSDFRFLETEDSGCCRKMGIGNRPQS